MGQETSQLPSSSDVLPGTPVGTAVVRRIRRLVVVALVAAFVYSGLMVASKGFCGGGVTADGGFLDAQGQPADSVPSCMQLVLTPSPLVLAAIAVIVLVALNRVIARALDAVDAVRILDRSAAVIAIVAAVSLVISHVWFWTIPIETWVGPTGFWVLAPFPFGGIDVDVTPMQAPTVG